MESVDIAKYMDKWRVHVSEENISSGSIMRGIYWLFAELLASEKGLCSMELGSC
jgi:hypothetical protein